MDYGQHFTFCCLCLYHSCLNSYFKNLNTSNTFLTLGEPHQPKHTLSTVFFNHDSMCHGKVRTGQKMITQNPELLDREFRVFREFQVITMAFFELFHLYQ